ncbi:MAG: protein phosphatase 2C domain-containing protein [Butyrivibrio sp.]|nr:protein phosphatase 2C domain-containing protein [Butyrivibrio sp.]
MYKTEKNKKAYLYTNAGKRHKSNQDAAIVKIAEYKEKGPVILAAVCDGMGGYSCGEVASSFVVKRLKKWFESSLKKHIEEYKRFEDIVIELNKYVIETGNFLKEYADTRKIMLGTTAVIFLQIGGNYAFINIGDSRGYIISWPMIKQLTHDQSLVQQKIDQGLLNKRTALKSSQQSIILQGLGVSKSLNPEITMGKIKNTESFLLCTDGFWRKLSNREINGITGRLLNYENIEERLKTMGEKAIKRGETDNLTAVVIA